jgi:hypothetical protein
MWVELYLCAGVVVWVALLLLHSRDSRGQQNSVQLASLQKPLTWREAFMAKVYEPVLASVIAVLIWPLALCLVWLSRQEEPQRIALKEEAVFAIRQADLLSHTHVAAVESMARVHDPLSAVPDLPFGHLNAAWQAFVDQRPPNAELWTFASDWTSDWGTTFARQGYVWVHGDECAPWMLTRDVLKAEGEVKA